jgi:DNA-binding beta-propeller fold protein YncE
VYVSDTFNHVIRRVHKGQVSTVAGKHGSAGLADGRGAKAVFHNPNGLVLDTAENTLYVVDYFNSCIRAVSLADSTVTTFSGSHKPTTVDGPVKKAQYSHPSAICMCPKTGNFYVTQCDDGVVRCIKRGAGEAVVSSFAKVGSSYGIAICPVSGNLFVSAYSANTVSVISPEGVVSLFAGAQGASVVKDGKGEEAQFTNPSGIVIDVTGTLFVADGSSIRKITPQGVVSTLCVPNIIHPFGISLKDSVGSSLFVVDINTNWVLEISPVFGN